MYAPVIVRFADHVAADETRLSVEDIAYLNRQMNVNTSDESDEWFDEELSPEYSEIIDEDEFFERYFPGE